jgi:hypothetical protein
MLHLYPLKAEILFISYMAAHPERLHNDSVFVRIDLS